MAVKRSEGAGAGEKGMERVAVWLTPPQVAWLKSKKNVSETMRAFVTEAMNLDLLKQSVKQASRPASRDASKPRPPQSRKGDSSRKRSR
jgi:hypothetical protein